MQLDIAHVLVSHPENICLIPLQSCKGGTLEITHYSRLLLLRGIILGMEGDHAAGVTPFPGVAVDQGAGEVRVARQNFRQHITANGLVCDALALFGIGGDLLGQQVFHRRTPRAIAMCKEAYHHRECSVTISASWRSIAIKSVRTATKSIARPALRSVFMARAIWLRLLPARPTAASSTGSTSGGSVRRCMGSLDRTWRTKSDRDRS